MITRHINVSSLNSENQAIFDTIIKRLNWSCPMRKENDWYVLLPEKDVLLFNWLVMWFD